MWRQGKEEHLYYKRATFKCWATSEEKALAEGKSWRKHWAEILISGSAWKNTAANAIAKAAVLEQSARPQTAVCYEDI